MSNFDSGANLYRNQRVVLLTQHGKGAIIGPVLDSAIGCRVETVTGFDTDLLGTFTRDIKRQGTQIEAARRKARIGMEISGCSLALANEGAFVADPMAGLLPWNIEIIVFIDAERDLEIIGIAQGPAHNQHRLVTSWDEMLAFVESCGFPEHQLALRPDHADDIRVRKNNGDWQALKIEFEWAQKKSTSGSVFIERDLRAHCNPTRQAMIQKAAENLAARLQSNCPACDAPGYWIAAKPTGLPCEWCNEPTMEFRSTIYRCHKCNHQNEIHRTDKIVADPQWCSMCNP